MKSTYFIGICFCVLSLSVGDLSIGPKKCGVKFCEKWEYCSNVDNFCRPCTDICEQNSHNFDPTICTSNCQGKRAINEKHKNLKKIKNWHFNEFINLFCIRNLIVRCTILICLRRVSYLFLLMISYQVLF